MRADATSLLAQLDDLADELGADELPDPDDPDAVLEAVQRWLVLIVGIVGLLVKLLALVGIEALRDR